MEKANDFILKYRKPDHEIAPYLYTRWSPRAMTGEPLEDQELFSLFEAARWAPSSFNEQPWIFCFAKRESFDFTQYYDLLVDFNKSWCEQASVLVIVLSRTHFKKNNEFSKTHSFDTGAAWCSLALEGSRRGLVVHGMSGFDYQKAKELVLADDSVAVEAMCAIGKKAPKENLPLDLQKKEFPSDRNPISSFIFEGKIKKRTG